MEIQREPGGLNFFKDRVNPPQIGSIRILEAAGSPLKYGYSLQLGLWNVHCKGTSPPLQNFTTLPITSPYIRNSYE